MPHASKGWEVVRGYPLAQLTGALEEHRELPQQGLGPKRIWYILGIAEHFCLQDKLNKDSILQAEMQYAMYTCIYQKCRIIQLPALISQKLSLFFSCCICFKVYMV